jgi:hypothetical protein
MRRCRSCAEEIPDAARMCHHCGRDSVTGKLAPAPPAPEPSGRALLAPDAREPSSGGGFLATLLVACALLSAGIGVVSLSQATLGVGLLCGGCFLAILARLVQADVQHRALKRTITNRP